MRYRGWMSRTALGIFVITFIALGWLGLRPATGLYTTLAQVFTTVYFLYFLLMPWYSKNDKCKPAPERVTYHAH